MNKREMERFESPCGRRSLLGTLLKPFFASIAMMKLYGKGSAEFEAFEHGELEYSFSSFR